MTFSVGQKVVLVGWVEKYVPAWKALGAVYPNVGDVYTIRAIRSWRDSAVLLLTEIDNSHLPYYPEPGFSQSFFRPIVERKTDISVFTEMLIPAGKERVS